MDTTYKGDLTNQQGVTNGAQRLLYQHRGRKNGLPYTFRTMLPEDIEGVVGILDTFDKEQLRHRYHHIGALEHLKKMERKRLRENGDGRLVIVAETGDVIVAAILIATGRCAEEPTDITLMVHDKHQSQGLASIGLLLALGYASEQSAPVEVFTTGTNGSMKKVVERLGCFTPKIEQGEYFYRIDLSDPERRRTVEQVRSIGLVGTCA